MNKECIKQAATVEQAKELIAAELGLPQDKITFEVLQEPGKKLLGLFGGKAEVKGTATLARARLPHRPHSSRQRLRRKRQPPPLRATAVRQQRPPVRGWNRCCAAWG